MKALSILLILFSIITCQSQNTELKPPFKTQGAQENYWAQELFKKQYNKTTFSIYSGKIEEISYIKQEENVDKYISYYSDGKVKAKGKYLENMYRLFFYQK